MLVGQRPDQADRLGDHVGHGHRLQRQRQPAGLDGRDVQDLVDQGQQMPGGREDEMEVLALLLFQLLQLQQLGEPEDGVQRGAQLVAHPRQVLALGRVRLVGRLLGLPQLHGALPHLLLDAGVAQPEVGGEMLLRRAVLLQAHDLGDVVDAVDDVGELPVGREDRRVDRAPEPDLEGATFGLGAADVVLLHRHRVGNAIPPHPLQRRPQVPLAGRPGVIRVVGEDLEQPPAHDARPDGHGVAQVGVAHGHDHQVGVEHEIGARCCLEQRLEIQRTHGPHHLRLAAVAPRLGSVCADAYLIGSADGGLERAR